MSSKKDWLGKTGKGVASWLDIDLDMFEEQLLKSLGDIADPTQLEWLDLMYRLESQEGLYHVGELAPAGDLSCTQCGKQIHLYIAQELTACARCHNIEFLYKDDNLH